MTQLFATMSNIDVQVGTDLYFEDSNTHCMITNFFFSIEYFIKSGFVCLRLVSASILLLAPFKNVFNKKIKYSSPKL